MNTILFFATIAIVIGFYLLFALLTEKQFYSSAIVSLFVADHKKWKLYKKAKKQGVKKYLTPKEYDTDYYNDYNNKCIPDFYLYPLPFEDNGIKYYLYTKDYEYITNNFQLISKL